MIKQRSYNTSKMVFQMIILFGVIMMGMLCHFSNWTSALVTIPVHDLPSSQEDRLYIPNFGFSDFQADTSEGPIRQIIERLGRNTVRSIYSFTRTSFLLTASCGKEFHHTRNYNVGSICLPIMFDEVQPLWLMLLNLLN